MRVGRPQVRGVGAHHVRQRETRQVPHSCIAWSWALEMEAEGAAPPDEPVDGGVVASSVRGERIRRSSEKVR